MSNKQTVVTKLRPAEVHVFTLGEEIQPPLSLCGEDTCFHLAIWFLTGFICPLRAGANYFETAPYLAELQNAGVLELEVWFETARVDGLAASESLLSLPSGTWLVLLLDETTLYTENERGHWIVITPDGVYDPAVNRARIALSSWLSLFAPQYSVRRVLRVTKNSWPDRVAARRGAEL